MPDSFSLVSPTFFLPLASAICFGVAAVLMKKTGNWKIDIWRISFVSNIVTGIAFQVFWLDATVWPNYSLLWQPAVIGILFIIGQASTLVSLTKGDISVAAPVLGLKIVFVPLFIWLLRIADLPKSMWMACVGATIAVALLNYTDRSESRGKALFSFVFAALGAASYAMFDICVQQWAGGWAGGGFLPIMFIMSMMMSLALIPLFQGKLREIPAAAWPFLMGSSVLFAIQSIGIVWAIAWWGNAASVNVVYSSRGMWSLLALWLLGRSLQLPEGGLSRRVLVVRVFGAIVLMFSIVILTL